MVRPSVADYSKHAIGILCLVQIDVVINLIPLCQNIDILITNFIAKIDFLSAIDTYIHSITQWLVSRRFEATY